MAKVLVFHNFTTEGEKPLWGSNPESKHDFSSIHPGVFQANPYNKSKHVGFLDLLKRVCISFIISMRAVGYNVLVLDSAITGFFVSVFLRFIKRPRIIISSFNVPRRRNRFWKIIARFVYKRVDHFVVHSTHDIDLVCKMLKTSEKQISFFPYVRDMPSTGKPSPSIREKINSPYIFSYGGNARDYKTFMDALDGTGINAVIAARDYNLRGLDIPDNVCVFTNIPLEDCDRLVSNCLFTCFTFDGTEPSCGQISIVTSFMLSKPVICSRWIGVMDYVEDGKNGLLAEIFNVEELRGKIRELYNNTELRNQLSEGATQWAAAHAYKQGIFSKIDSLIAYVL